MAEPTNRRVLLARRPDGLVREDDFSHDVASVPEPADGELLVRTEWIGIDATVRTWLSKAEGYIPPGGTHADDPRFLSHETACLLNTNAQDAQVALTIYFKDRDPAGPYRVTVPARRTLHLRFNDLTDPERLDLSGNAALNGVPVTVQPA